MPRSSATADSACGVTNFEWRTPSPRNQCEGNPAKLASGDISLGGSFGRTRGRRWSAKLIASWTCEVAARWRRWLGRAGDQRALANSPQPPGPRASGPVQPEHCSGVAPCQDPVDPVTNPPWRISARRFGSLTGLGTRLAHQAWERNTPNTTPPNPVKIADTAAIAGYFEPDRSRAGAEVTTQ